MKKLLILLVLLLLYLQYHLWFGDGSLQEVWRLRQDVEQQRQENARLRERNAALDAEVRDLKQGYDAIEERARYDLGMIKQDEIFFEVLDKPAAGAPPAPGWGNSGSCAAGTFTR